MCYTYQAAAYRARGALFRLANLRLSSVEVGDDGNCLFRALSQQLYGSQEYHAAVRAAIVERMRSEEAFFGAMFEGDEFDKYLRAMARRRTWGDELCLRAAADWYGVLIHLVTSTSENWYLRYEPAASPPNKHCFLTYISPVHYEAFVATPPLHAAPPPGGARIRVVAGGGAAPRHPPPRHGPRG